MTVTWTIAGATGEGGNQTGIGRAASLSTPMTGHLAETQPSHAHHGIMAQVSAVAAGESSS
ncbi:hypothetical protein [Roseiflexus sp.]|uniref:hypothetical protein n=1 Tax=Roseiflexus sp. TaxID=2562120 RepID=UPI00398A8B99